MKIFLLICSLIMTGLASPALAQPQAQASPAISAAKLEARKAEFAWLLGSWQAKHMFGPNSSRSGARITFFMENDGTVSARLDRMSPWMKSSEKRFKALVGKRFARGIHTSGRPRSVWPHSAHGGRVFDKNSGNWTNLGIIYTSPEDGELSHVGAMSDFSHWIKISGSTRTNAPQPVGTSAAPNGKKTSSQTNAGGTNRTDKTGKKAEEKRGRCDMMMYPTLLNHSTGKVITGFTDATETVAGYDPGLPGARLYPSPIKRSSDIPSFLDTKDFAILEQLEAITNEMAANRGPDDWLKQNRNRIRQLHVIARDKYDGAAKRAADAFKPCPPYSEAIPYSHLAEAEKIMAALRQRRDNELKPLLSEGNRLNEALTRQFYGKLADANTLDEKAKTWARQEITDMLRGENVKKSKIKALTPQLEALQKRYRRLETEGNPVSEKQRDSDLKAALKKSGINYDPSQARHAKRDGAVKIGKTAYGYIRGLIVGSGTPNIISLSSKAAGYVGLAKDTAEIINAVKNLYDLWGVRQDLMPTSLAVTEDRAYLLGLIDRYDIVEQEYGKMKKLFENSVTNSAEIANRE